MAFTPQLERLKRLISTAVVLLVCNCSVKLFAQDDLPALIKRLQPAVVTIVTFDKKNKPLSRGTGFFVGANYHQVVTARHVLEGAYTAHVRIQDGSEFTLFNVEAENVDAGLISGLVFEDGSLRLTLFYGYNISTPLHVAATLPDVGERVFVIGTPLGYGQTVSDGIVSAVRNIEPYGQVIQITAPISPGSSGSPVFNMRGEVIGVAISQVVDGQNLNFAIPAERIQSLSQIDIREVFLDERSNRHEATKAALTEDDVGYSLCHEQGKRQEGIKHFQHAVQLSPSFAFAWYHLGECQQDLGQHEAAIKSYETASRVYPAFFNSLYSAGATYYELHRYTEAIESFEKANQARPCCLMELPAYDRIGAIYAELKRYDEAVAAYAALADTYAIQGLAPSAVRYYKKAIRLKPDHAYAHYMLGRLYSDDGDKAAALDEYKILMNLDHDLTAKLFDEIYK